MAENSQTPCGALFAAMKKQGGMSYKELAGLVLSGRPLADGRSPVSRVDDRTWVSRFVVHAPVGSLQERYFCDFGTAALRIIARLKARRKRALTSGQILEIVQGEGGRAMETALAGCHQDVSLYRNVLERLADGAGYTDDERAEIAMTLFVAAGCTGDVRKAAHYAVGYARTIHGENLATTPAASLGDTTDGGSSTHAERAIFSLGLVRVVDGYVKGGAHWVSPDGDGVEIGALAFGENDVTDVGSQVSGRHAHVWCDADGRWLVEDLGSRNGTVVISGVSRERIVVTPPRDERKTRGDAGAADVATEEAPAAAPSAADCAEDSTVGGADGDSVDAQLTVSDAVEIHPGDELVLGGDTAFALVAGLRE